MTKGIGVFEKGAKIATEREIHFAQGTVPAGCQGISCGEIIYDGSEETFLGVRWDCFEYHSKECHIDHHIVGIYEDYGIHLIESNYLSDEDFEI